MTEKQSTLTGIEKKYRYSQADGDYPKIIKGDITYCFAFPFDAQMLCEELNEMVETIETLKEENEQLKKQIERIDFILDDLNGQEYISRDDAINGLNKIDKAIK